MNQFTKTPIHLLFHDETLEDLLEFKREKFPQKSLSDVVQNIVRGYLQEAR